MVRDEHGKTLRVDGARVVFYRNGVQFLSETISDTDQLDQNYQIRLRMDMLRGGTQTYASLANATGTSFSAELLRDLRDPSTFGLIPTDKPKPSLPGDISRPDWHPELSKDAGAEILQHPSQSLTLQYHAKENLLYASDYGKGFAKGLSY